MKDFTQKLAAHVRVETDSARRERQWSTIEAAISPRRAWMVRATWSTAAVCAVAALVVGGARLWPDAAAVAPSAQTQDVEIEGRVGGHPITLPDGSRAALAPEARIRLAEARKQDIRILLDRGRLDLQVVPALSTTRRFLVVAGFVEVRVTGTAFSVDRAVVGGRESVTVAVSHGQVMVRRRGETREWPVPAGESLTSTAPLEDSSASSHAAETQLEVPSTEPAAEPAVASAPRAEIPVKVHRHVPRRKAAVRKASLRRVALASSGANPAAPASEAAGRAPAPSFEPAPPAVAPPPVAVLPSARELLLTAEQARRAGRFREAESALESVRGQHRSDPRAALAAFELGRLRLDQLHDFTGAADALRDAVRLAPDASFREHVEARLVEALAGTGDTSACRRARHAFLDRYAQSTHRPVILSLCVPTK